jgi:hypothetical protein
MSCTITCTEKRNFTLTGDSPQMAWPPVGPFREALLHAPQVKQRTSESCPGWVLVAFDQSRARQEAESRPEASTPHIRNRYSKCSMMPEPRRSRRAAPLPLQSIPVPLLEPRLRRQQRQVHSRPIALWQAMLKRLLGPLRSQLESPRRGWDSALPQASGAAHDPYSSEPRDTCGRCRLNSRGDWVTTFGSLSSCVTTVSYVQPKCWPWVPS